MAEKKLTLTVSEIDSDITSEIKTTGFNLAEIVGHLESIKHKVLLDWEKKKKKKSSVKAK